MKFTQKPEVALDWLYWIYSFMWCTSLIGWLAHKEQQGSGAIEEARAVQSGATFYPLTTIAAYITFTFSPHLADWPYG